MRLNMKTLAAQLAVVAAATLGIAAPASANVHEVRLIIAQLELTTACAVDVEVRAVEMNLFNGSESLEIDSASVGTFAPLTEMRMNISVGTHVLFASDDFASSAGITPDVTLNSDVCANIAVGSNFRFVGSFGDEAANITLPEGFGPNFAFNGTELTDLGVAALLLYNASGTSIPLGEGPVAMKTSDSGCSIARRPGGATPATFGLLTLLGLAMLRRRH